MRLFWGILIGCGGAAFAACTSDAQVGATFSVESGSGPGDGGAGGTAASSDSASSSTGTSSSSSSSSGAGAGGAGGGGAGGAGVGGAGCDYSATDTCQTATELSSIDGDTGNDTRTVKGAKSAWYQVLVNEGSLGSNQLSYTATLVPPPGMAFDLYAYTGNGSATNCLGSAKQAIGSPASVSDTWSDTFGSDDSRWITLEVRYISGSACSPAPEWTLTMSGHTNP